MHFEFFHISIWNYNLFFAFYTIIPTICLRRKIIFGSRRLFLTLTKLMIPVLSWNRNLKSVLILSWWLSHYCQFYQFDYYYYYYYYYYYHCFYHYHYYYYYYHYNNYYYQCYYYNYYHLLMIIFFIVILIIMYNCLFHSLFFIHQIIYLQKLFYLLKFIYNSKFENYQFIRYFEGHSDDVTCLSISKDRVLAASG